MREMVAIGLDVEPEQPLADVKSRCEASALAIALYTSHNYNRTTDSAPVDSILKHGPEVTTDTVRVYLGHKGAYSEDFISQCYLTDPRSDIDGKIQVVWSCPPLQKMRVIVLLEQPVDVTALDVSPKRGQEIWANKVRGIADMLGLQIDPVATDPSRILYVAKHRPGADHYTGVFRGRPVQWDEIPEVAKTDGNAFLQAGKGTGGSTIPDVVVTAPSGAQVDVTALYRRYGKRWLLTDMLSDSHVAKGSGSDKLHVECPFSDELTSESGRTSTTVWDAGETEHGFAKVLCQHSCKEKYPHTVNYVARWIEDGVIDPAWLEDSSFMIGADQPGRFEELTPAEEAEEHPKIADEFEPIAGWLPKGYAVRGQTIYLKGDEQDTPLCQLFNVVGRASNEAGDGGAGRIIQFRNGNGIDVEMTIDRKDIMKDGGGEIIDKLADAEMDIDVRDKKGKGQLLDLLHRITPQRRIATVRRPGWTRNRSGEITGFL